MSHPHKRLYLIRHGEVEEQYHKRFGGSIDMDLSSLGHEQARALAHHLQSAPLDHVYISPLQRAQKTAAPLLQHHTHLTPTTLPDLREIDFGAWSGLHWHEVPDHFNQDPFDWLHLIEQSLIPDAEPGHQFQQRIQVALHQILHSPYLHPAVICHGGVIRMLLSLITELPLAKMRHFDIEYASLTLVDLLPPQTPSIRLHNFTPWNHPVRH